MPQSIFHWHKPVFFLILSLVLGLGCGRRQNPTPQLASGKAFVLPNDSAKEVFKEKPAPVWAPRKFGFKPSANRNWDLVHTRLDLSFNRSRKEMLGKATLRLKPHFYPQGSIELDARYMDIKTASLLTSKNETRLTFTYDSLKIKVNLPRIYQKGELLEIEIAYAVRPDEKPKGGSQAIRSNQGLYFINADGKEEGKPFQIWTQGEPESASQWFPTLDAPNQRSTQEMYLTVDKSLKTLSNGVLLYSKDVGKNQRLDVWEMDKPHAPYLFMLAIGDFAVVKDKWKNIPLQYWVEPAYQSVAKKIFGQTPKMIEFFSQKLGTPFPWPKYDQVVVRDFVSGAMENTTASVFMEALQSSHKELVDRNWDDIIAHELFHQWFGDLVTLESWAHLPLNESFANYSQYLWDEYRNGKDEADLQALKEKQSYLFESGRKREPLIRYYHRTADDMFDSHSYAKGGRILHQLRTWLGNEAFFEGLKLYLHRHAFSSVEVHNLRMAMEEISGQDLQWFFNQWFMSAGHPNLDVSWTITPQALVIKTHQSQDTTYQPVFRLPIKIEIWSDGQCQTQICDIQMRDQTFSFPLSGPFQTLIWDVDQTFIGELEMPQPLPLLSWQYQLASGGLHRLEALQKLKQDFSDDPEAIRLFSKALDDSFWACRLVALEGIAAQPQQIEPNLESIKKLAISDPKPQVRTQALRTLSRTPFDGKKQWLQQAMEDSSLSASSMAYKIYILENYEDVDEKIKKIKPEEEDLYAGVFAAYYSRKSEQGAALDWFIQKLKNPELHDPYEMTLSMGQCMGKIADSIQVKKGLDFLYGLATKKSKPELVIGAYQVLLQFRQLPGVADKLFAIRELWKGDELEEILNYIE